MKYYERFSNVENADYYRFDEILTAALKGKEEDIYTLADWMYRWGMDDWNGEKFSFSYNGENYTLKPSDYEELPEGHSFAGWDEYGIVDWDLRRE